VVNSSYVLRTYSPKNLTIRSTGGNGDGIDIDSCNHVRIDGCDISTGDDCISLKSGRGMGRVYIIEDNRRRTDTNCTFADSIFACIGIGSETSGGIRNVRIQHCTFTEAKHLPSILRAAGARSIHRRYYCRRSGCCSMRGGFLRFNILTSGLQDQVPVPDNEGIPTIKNFSFTNIRVHDVPILVDGTGIHPSKPLQGLH